MTLLGLPDESLYPTHGAGSFCNAPASSGRVSTIGQERLFNPLAQAPDEESFVKRSLSNLPSYPTYFKYLRSINQRGPAILGGIPVLKALNPDEVEQLNSQGVVILDTRPSKAFTAGHIPGSYGIPLKTPLNTWTGWVIPFGSPLILVSKDAKEREAAVRQLIRIGYDDLRGYLLGELAAWQADGRPVWRVPVMPVQELAERIEQGKAPVILDVRFAAEWRAGHLPKAKHIEAGRLDFEYLSLPRDKLKVIHCGHSDRSTVGISVLERRGVTNLAILDGGYSDWQTAGLKIENQG
jgi:hydroxyacylglutathione hydrolase